MWGSRRLKPFDTLKKIVVFKFLEVIRIGRVVVGDVSKEEKSSDHIRWEIRKVDDLRLAL